MADGVVPPDFEAMVELCARQVLRPGDGAIDAGAHKGRHLRPMLEAVGPTGHVLAIEPLPDCLRQVRDELGDHPGLTLVPGVLGPRRETLELVVALDRPEESSLRARSNYSGPTALTTLAVEAHPLDELAAGMARVDFVKIDVEGAEALVVESGLRTLGTHQPVITFEHGIGIADFDGTSAGLFGLLDGLGDLVFTIDGRRLASARDLEEVVGAGQMWDFVAIPAAHPLVDSLPALLAHEMEVRRVVDEGIAAAYRSVLHRDPDAAGLTAFRHVCREQGPEVLVRILQDSDEARAMGGDGSP
ncbi:FkbM family methyltransferase [Iamia sp. SCSIO 61187]|uniref:FkbM family methyltransferase n=1 Tax=Iamia sp. SCSIO 61187 TaxID=2722752 RepID=UPI001C639794|nr:FkbM family methyltransferase [Iamia sp. SCSIO 61187]QYG94004.1 FkbM family methyltransferase [Iamia sp. SCSIO 61187]